MAIRTPTLHAAAVSLGPSPPTGGDSHPKRAAMRSFLSKFKSAPRATPLHYAIVATSIFVALLMVTKRFF